MSLCCELKLDRGAFSLDVAFEIPAAGVTAVFGPTGSGKTTLLRCIAGLEPSVAGSVRFGGDVWQDTRCFLPAHRRRVGFVFQDAALFPHLDVRGNVEYGLRRVPATEPRLALAPVLDLLGLKDLTARRVEGLSGGERQRVAIARAVLGRPRLLLMDEPLASLDRGARRRILPYLENLTRELDLPVLYVSHALDEAARLADRLLLLDVGRVLAEGPIEGMLTRLDLPLARDERAESVVVGRVAGFEPEDGLMRVEFSGGGFLVPARDIGLGETVRIRILARDVSLTRSRHDDTSILNVFPARVLDLRDEGPARCIVRLDLDGTPLLALVTRRSVRELGIRSGASCYAQVKTAAVLD